MSPRDLVYVGHMLDMARKAVSKTQDLSREADDGDEIFSRVRFALSITECVGLGPPGAIVK